jgi:hypothetical protein
MRIAKTVGLTLCGAALCAALATSARANDYNKKTVVTFRDAVEVPGQVLPPGTYTFMLLDSQANRNLLEIWNANQNKLLATIQTIPELRVPPGDRPIYSPDQPILQFDERPLGHPMALRSFFFPGSLDAQQFVYNNHDLGR